MPVDQRISQVISCEKIPVLVNFLGDVNIRFLPCCPIAQKRGMVNFKENQSDAIDFSAPVAIGGFTKWLIEGPCQLVQCKVRTCAFGTLTHREE